MPETSDPQMWRQVTDLLVKAERIQRGFAEAAAVVQGLQGAARIELLPVAVPVTPEFAASVLHMRQQVQRVLALLPRPLPELQALLDRTEGPALLANLVLTALDLPLGEKQALLAEPDLGERVRRVSGHLAREIDVLDRARHDAQAPQAPDPGGPAQAGRRPADLDAVPGGPSLRQQIRDEVRSEIRALQQELAPEDAGAAGIAELRRRIEDADMPAEVVKQALRELDRLSRMPEAAAEYSMTRTYLEWLLDVPWSTSSEEHINIKEAREILEAEHHGLQRVKRRIIEFLAVRKLNPGGKSPILCFLGPPGVGKTSLGQSIARATKRRFVRQSLGGVNDEAEIRGHRRTYLGAMPGRIIQGIRKAGTRNPVFMLDEIDKITSGARGDPAAALLEVLDPEQNVSFEDHYLGVPFDLGQVMFIATANVLSNVPRPLRDRMEVIEIPGYTEEDKIAIARRFLLPRQLREAGLLPTQLQLDETALREMIRSYTRESGVRQLGRELGAVCRAVATLFAEGETAAVSVADGELKKYLGPVKYFNEVALRTSLPGVATGLAWTPTGGEILFVEVTRMPGEGKLILTGQLGDVMRESAQTALSLVKSRADVIDVPAEFFRNHDLHLHIPSGAIPKDGPSAGVTIFVAIVSMLIQRHIRHDVAMTGEISLRGLVLPVGGVKEKVLAARRAGIKRVLMPDLNQIDLDDDIPKEVLDALDIRFVQTVDDALELALEPEEEQPAAAPKGEGERNHNPEQTVEHEPVREPDRRAAQPAEPATGRPYWED